MGELHSLAWTTLFFLRARNLVLQSVDLGVLLLDRILQSADTGHVLHEHFSAEAQPQSWRSCAAIGFEIASMAKA